MAGEGEERERREEHDEECEGELDGKLSRGGEGLLYILPRVMTRFASYALLHVSPNYRFPDDGICPAGSSKNHLKLGLNH